MTLADAKEKLHDFIDHADEEKIFELLLLLNEDKVKDHVYSDEILSMLRERSELYLSGQMKTYTVEESMERIRKHRAGDGV